MWKLSIEDDQGQVTVVNLARDTYSVGRAEDNTIRLTERNISRHHARLVRSGNSWFLEDHQSYNGAYVNGVRVGGRQELAHGDLVQLGDYRIELIDEALDTREQGHRRISTSPDLPRRDTLAGQPDRFVMLIGPTQGAEFGLVGEHLIIGRGEECDISINHASVSRVHAEVRRLEGGRFELVDKGSANGVRVNGHELERTLLDARDVVELGDVVLKYIPKGQIYVPDPDETHQLGALTSSPPPPVSSGGHTEKKTWLTISVATALAAVAGGWLAMRDTGPDSTGAAPQLVSANLDAPSETPESRALRDALVQLKEGDVFGAHQTLGVVSTKSPVAETEDFRRIETEWASAMLAAARGEKDLATKREILTEVAEAMTVGKEMRDAALAELAKTYEEEEAAGHAEAIEAAVPPSDASKLPATPTTAKPRRGTPSEGSEGTSTGGTPTPTAPQKAPTQGSSAAPAPEGQPARVGQPVRQGLPERPESPEAP